MIFQKRIVYTITRTCVQAYREAIASFSTMKVLDVWYARLDIDSIIKNAPDAEAKRNRERIATEARAHITEYIFPKITKVHDGRRLIVDELPLVYHPPPEEQVPEGIIDAFQQYRETLPYERRVPLDRYHIEDIAYKVVGVGSVGTRCGVLLLMAEENDPLLLQVKEANPSVLEPYAGKSQFKHSGGKDCCRPASDAVSQRHAARVGDRERKTPLLCPAAQGYEILFRCIDKHAPTVIPVCWFLRLDSCPCPCPIR